MARPDADLARRRHSDGISPEGERSTEKEKPRLNFRLAPVAIRGHFSMVELGWTGVDGVG